MKFSLICELSFDSEMFELQGKAESYFQRTKSTFSSDISSSYLGAVRCLAIIRRFIL